MFNTIPILHRLAYDNQYAETSHLSRIISSLHIFLIVILLNHLMCKIVIVNEEKLDFIKKKIYEIFS